MKAKIIKILMMAGVLVLLGQTEAMASSTQVIFQIPVQIDYPGDNVSPRIDCFIFSKNDLQGSGHVGGIPNKHLRSNINVRVRAKSGKRFSKGMKYKCHLTPKGFRDDFTYNLVVRGARAAVNREIINNARKAVVVISGTL